MRRIWISTIVLASCQDGTGARREPDPAPAPARTIELRDARSNQVTARVAAGRPCRATVDERELIVGGRPLVATSGAAHWTGEDAPNGTTFKLNDRPVARIHAKQLFDAEGIPLVRVLDNGDIASGAGRIIRHASASADSVTIRSVPPGDDPGVIVTNLPGGPDDLPLAALLAAPEASREVRALVACHYLLPDAP